MIAVLNIGGKQLKVEEKTEFYVDRILGKKGDKLTFDNITLIQDSKGTTIGNPNIVGAKVNASILEQKKDKKIIVFKKKRRKGYRVKNGHRQMITKIKIDSISVSKKTKEETTTKKTTTKKTTAKKTTAKKTTTKK